MADHTDYASASAHVFNIGYIQAEETKAAYFALLVAGERAGLRTKAVADNAVTALQFFDGRDQPFSLIPNRKHLLFYLRPVFLRERPSARDDARQLFPTTFKGEPNSANEAHFRLHDVAEAERLIDWLFPIAGYAARRSA